MGEEKFDKDDMPFKNRHLSWMDFNMRVLEEAMSISNPIMERLKFLSITASNLDEFFMIRVAEVMDKKLTKPGSKDSSGLKPKQLLGMLTSKIHKFYGKQYSCFFNQILPSLGKIGVKFLKWDDLNLEQMSYAEDYFEKIIFPVLTPLAVDMGRPFPFLSNKSLNIAVEFEKNQESLFGIVQVPSILPRYIEIPSLNGKSYILLENIIRGQLSRLFELNSIKSSCTFRITRNSDIEIDEGAQNLLTEIEKSIKKRKRGDLVRLEIGDKTSKGIKKFLVSILDVGKKEIYEARGPIDLTFLSKFYNEEGDSKLKFGKLKQVSPPADFVGCTDIFKAIREKDRMVYHPFETFDWVTNFIQAAAEDESVLAIKQVLYRVSGNSPIIAALIKAAENGKQVTVLVELKARFDEENNIGWAKKLEKAGCHVIYGLTGLKVHCKVLLVVRREGNLIRRYIHFGTGNYNDTTAKFYTDIGIFTCNEDFGRDASSLFNSLTGYSKPPEYKKLVVAPMDMRQFFKNMIENETENAKRGLPSKIVIKINAVVDSKIIKDLYLASNAGVDINLIVRGMCCLIPGVKGYSENIQVRSIVGRFLEHSRIFYFENAGSPKIYMGSADLMPRNLDRRVEILFPVEDTGLRERTVNVLNILLNDTKNARIQDNKGKYHRINYKDEFLDSQMELFKLFGKNKKKNNFKNNIKIFTPRTSDDIEQNSR